MSDEGERALILENFQTITNNQDIGVCLAILEEHNWNLDEALKSTVGSEQEEEMNRAGPSPSSSSRASTSTPSPSPPPSSQSSSAPQRVSSNQPIRQANSGPGGLLSFFHLTFTFFFRFAQSLPIIGYLIRRAGFSPRNSDGRDPNPVAAAARFLLNYEQKYGQTHPEFFQGSYNQALQRASLEVKFLLAYMHCDDHQDTERFCRQVLPSQEFRSFLHEKEVVFWAGDIKEIEPYQVSLALGVSTYPFLGLVGLQGNRMTLLGRVEGYSSLPDLLTKLNQLTSRFGGALRAAKMERESREFERQLREQQKMEYDQALREDQEKERRKKEELEREEKEKERKRKEEEDARIAEENKIKDREMKKASLPDEPAAGKGVTTIRVRLPTSTIQRRFLETDTVQVLYNFVESNELPYSSISLTTSMPKRVYDDKSITLKEAGLCPNATVFVEGNL